MSDDEQISIGRVDVVMGADPDLERVHKKAGKVAGQAAGVEFGNKAGQAVQRVVGALFGPQAGALAGKAAGRAVGGGFIGQAAGHVAGAKLTAAGRGAAVGGALAGRGAAGVAGAAGGAAGAASAIPVIGIFLAAAAAAGFALKKLVKKLQQASAAVEAESRRLSRVDPLLAVVETQKLIGQFRRDIARGQVLGPGIATIERTKERRRAAMLPTEFALKQVRNFHVLLWEQVKEAGVRAFGVGGTSTIPLATGQGFPGAIVNYVFELLGIIKREARRRRNGEDDEGLRDANWMFRRDMEAILRGAGGDPSSLQWGESTPPRGRPGSFGGPDDFGWHGTLP